jgi:hypothetical protein
MPLPGTLDAARILVGGAQVKIGAYVADAAAGSLLTFGHTLTPTEFSFGFTDFDVITEQSQGRVKSVPQDADYQLKLEVAQNDTEAMLIATRQAAANLTSAGLNLAFNDPVEIYYQVALVGVGYGSTKVDTYTFWRVQVKTTGPIPFAKAGVQKLTMTLGIFRDDSVVTTPLTKGLYGRRVVA